MTHDLHERVVERIRVGGRTEDVAAAIIPVILEEAAKGERTRMREALEAAWQQSIKMRNAAKVVGPYPNDPAKNKIWQRGMYHAGKDLQDVLKPARAAITAAKGPASE